MSLTDWQLAEIFKEIKSTYPEPPYLADLISELREAREENQRFISQSRMSECTKKNGKEKRKIT